MTATRAFQGFFAIDRHLVDIPELGVSITREVFVRGPAACVLVCDPVRQVALLVEEFRIGNHAAGLDPISLGPIAGMVEPGQSPRETVVREAAEEAGITAPFAALYGPFSTLPSPGGSSEIIHHFIALADLDPELDGATFGLASEGEYTRVRLVPVAQLEGLLLDRAPANGLLATCMLWLSVLVGRMAVGGIDAITPYATNPEGTAITGWNAAE